MLEEGHVVSHENRESKQSFAHAHISFSLFHEHRRKLSEVFDIFS